MSLKQKAFVAGLAMTLATCVLGGAALGAKRITYAQAWRLCKAELDQDKVYSNWVSNDRYLRGGACMQKYGYRF